MQIESIPESESGPGGADEANTGLTPAQDPPAEPPPDEVMKKHEARKRWVDLTNSW